MMTSCHPGTLVSVPAGKIMPADQKNDQASGASRPATVALSALISARFSEPFVKRNCFGQLGLLKTFVRKEVSTSLRLAPLDGARKDEVNTVLSTGPSVLLDERAVLRGPSYATQSAIPLSGAGDRMMARTDASLSPKSIATGDGSKEMRR
ncbi:hypothetical protein M514_06975 [Trichuris suis]|uniref:Uncharacterized protein n=1 Tax=Trichuris suis TaxID=68888 RepID=A0A085N6Q6_9BILA|nr:hypothetical protein M514_06975 [Trichuris suis]